MRRFHFIRTSLLAPIVIVGSLTVHVGCASQGATDDRSHSSLTPPSSEAKALGPENERSLRDVSEKVFGIKWSGRVLAVSDRGFEILTDQVTTLSYRPTGNAFFVQNSKASLSQPSFDGSEGDYIKRGNAILAGLGIEASEIAEAKVLQHFLSK